MVLITLAWQIEYLISNAYYAGVYLAIQNLTTSDLATLIKVQALNTTNVADAVFAVSTSAAALALSAFGVY
jgi:hypothetical protein